MKSFVLAIVLAALAPISGAQVSATKRPNVVLRAFGRVGRFVKTHKEEEAQIALFAGAMYADAASSVYAQQHLHKIELNPSLGQHPGALETYGMASATVFAFAAVDQTIHWQSGGSDPWIDPYVRHVLWVPVFFLDGEEAFNVRSNLCGK